MSYSLKLWNFAIVTTTDFRLFHSSLTLYLPLFPDKTIRKKNPYTIKMPLICQGGGDECGIGGRASMCAQPHHHPFGNNPKVQWQPHQCTLNHPGRTRVAIFRYFPGHPQNFPDTSKCTRSVPMRALRLRGKRDQMCWTWVNQVNCCFVLEKIRQTWTLNLKMYSPDKMMGAKGPTGLHGPITSSGACFAGRYSPTYRNPDPMPRRCMPNPSVSPYSHKIPDNAL